MIWHCQRFEKSFSEKINCDKINVLNGISNMILILRKGVSHCDGDNQESTC
jgi:hypothetical protein